ncbi:MAG: hypothetical protein ACRDOY_07600 [Nocardioidaceae bacterium]
MKAQAARRLAWSMWAMALVLMAGPVVEVARNYVGPADLIFAVAFVGAQVCAATAGLVIARRLPRHPVGWIFLSIGVGMGLSLTAGAYADLSVTTNIGPLPAYGLAEWLGAWLFVPVAFGLPMFLVLLFPSGRFLTARWRVVGWVLGIVLATASAGAAFAPGPFDGPLGIEYPLGAPGTLGSVMTVVEEVTTYLALPCLGLAVAGLVVRFRRATATERQQLKWFTYAAGLVGAGLAGSIIVPGGWLADTLFLVGLLALCGLPITAGIAILRHRLYDIDVVINKTLVYGALTVTLAVIYLGSVLLLQLALRPLTADSGLAVAGSTLAVAALFRPARARIQAVVDRRFFRRRYDAARTLEAFGVRLRDELDLDTMGRDLSHVVRDTVQPAHVSLWLREVPR